jgi:glycosyltransferase involved in cell wall biosynthesis
LDNHNDGAMHPRVLCVLPGVPLPADTGGALRTLSLARAIDDAYDATVLSWARPSQEIDRFRARMRGVVHGLRPPKLGDSALAEAICFACGGPLGYSRYGLFPRRAMEVLAREKFDVIHFDHPHTALALPFFRRLQPQAKLVLDAHNVEAHIIQRLIPTAPLWQRPLLRWQSRRIHKLEQRLAGKMDLIITCSEKDADAFRAMGARRVRVVTNAVPAFAPLGGAVRRDLLFVGSFDWRPNAEAAVTLATKIWPLVRGKLGGARLVLVGRNPPPLVRALHGGDIVLAGNVPSVQPYLEQAFATAIPLRAASGTRIKILEAWAAGVPVVSSRTGAEGLPYTDGHDLILAESPAEFARALLRVQADAALAESLAEAGRHTAEPFASNKVAESLVAAYRDELGVLAAESDESARRYSATYPAAIASAP